MTELAPSPWEPQQGETQRAYGYFLKFLELPTEERSVIRLTEVCDISKKMAYYYSSKYNWLERATAYEGAQITANITVRQMALEDFQQAVVEQESELVAVITTVLAREWNKVAQRQDEGKEVSAKEIVSLTNASQKALDLTRRVAQLPVTYKTERVDDPEIADEVYIIGED